MQSALAFKGYEHQFEFGSQGHTLAQGAQLLESSIKWLFTDDDE